MLNAYTLFAAQIAAHAGLAILILKGGASDFLTAFAVYFVMGCIGVSCVYHRLLSHRSWKAPKIFEWFGALSAGIGLVGSAVSWAAIHRKHHRFADTEKDPHSPSHKGFIFCQWLSMFAPVNPEYVVDLLRSPFYRFQHKWYFVFPLAYMAVLYRIDPFLTVSMALAPSALLWNGGSLIVTLAHMWEKPGASNHSRNSFLLSLLIWGEGWHANHHADPRSPRFGKYWWQWDPGWYVIVVVEAASEFFRRFRRGVQSHNIFRSAS